jgi:hypothetical protein
MAFRAPLNLACVAEFSDLAPQRQSALTAQFSGMTAIVDPSDHVRADDLDQLRTDDVEFFPEGEARDLWLKWVDSVETAPKLWTEEVGTQH